MHTSVVDEYNLAKHVQSHFVTTNAAVARHVAASSLHHLLAQPRYRELARPEAGLDEEWAVFWRRNRPGRTDISPRTRLTSPARREDSMAEQAPTAVQLERLRACVHTLVSAARIPKVDKREPWRVGARDDGERHSQHWGRGAVAHPRERSE